MAHNKFEVMWTEIKEEIDDKNYCGKYLHRKVLHFEGKSYADIFVVFVLFLSL